MSRRKQKQFVLRQGLGGLLTSIVLVWVLAMILQRVPTDFWRAVGFVVWLAVAGAIALSINRLVRRADDR